MYKLHTYRELHFNDITNDNQEFISKCKEYKFTFKVIYQEMTVVTQKR